jgi:protein-S-isoprenylcysteine O-methyltransferase Ste14
MALREEFENSGNWLFRWRSYLPVILLILFLITMKNYTFPGGDEKLLSYWEYFCLSISAFGLLIRIITIGHTHKNTSGRNTKRQVAETLNTTGIYSVVRHPLYLGNYFMCLGIAMLPCMWYLPIIYSLVFWIYYERIMFAEEAFLRKVFSDDYLSWSQKTPAFLPRFKNYTKPKLPFSFRNVLKREYNGFFAVIFVFFIFNQLSILTVKHRFELDKLWLINLFIAFTVWLTLRTLKKKTCILHVEGR